MQIIIQKVANAKVFEGMDMIASISIGYLIYLCFHRDDTVDVVKRAAKRLKTLKMYKNKAIQDDESFLFITNFSILGKTNKNHISFHRCMNKMAAGRIYEVFLLEMRKLHPKVQNSQYATEYSIKSTVVGPYNLLVEFRDQNTAEKNEPQETNQ